MNSYKVDILRESDPAVAYNLVVESGEGLYVWFCEGQYRPITYPDYNTLEDLRHGCGNVYASLKGFPTAGKAAEFSSPIPNALADAFLREISRESSGVGFRIH